MSLAANARTMALLGLLSLGLLFACGSGESGPEIEVAAKGKGVVEGVVVDLAGAPQAGATVEGRGERATTGTDGRFRLEGLPEGTLVPVRARAAGSTVAHVLADLTDGPDSVRMVLAPTQAGELADAAAGGVVTAPDGLEIELSGGVADAEGKPVTGPVTVRWARAQSGELLAAAPALHDELGQPLHARTVLSIEVERDGVPLEVTGPVKVRLPAGTAPADLTTLGTLWTYIEPTAAWRAEGSVAITGDRLELTLPHLSWWMAGGPAAASGCAGGTVLRADGKPAAGASVYASGVDYLGNNATTADASGRFCLLIAATGTTRLAYWYEDPSSGATLYGEDLVVLAGDTGACGGSGCRELGSVLLTEPAKDDDGDGVADADGDCDDDDPLVRPGATERCNGKDDNCDGKRLSTEYDADGDGWFKCNGDCNDTKATVHPGAVEACDGVDDDCSGSIDKAELDQDGDGWSACEGDCDDTRASVHPDATELCDGLDTDCDGTPGEGEVDQDGDGHTVCAGDCDDADPKRFPGAAEQCNDMDDSCGQRAERKVPQTYSTIGAALAASASGDAVCVGPGQYAERLDFGGRNVRVVGTAGASKTVINGDAGGSVVAFRTGETGEAVLEGFTLVNGRAANGGGIYIKGASPTLRRVVVAGCEATASGGGIYLENGSPILEDVELKGNSAVSAAGLQIYASGNPKCEPVIERLNAHDNVTLVSGTGNGGGVYCSGFGSTAGGSLRDSRIEDNEAHHGGGLVIEEGCGTALERLVIAGNKARGNGGGVYAHNSTNRLSHAAIVANSAAGSGGAIALYWCNPSWRHLAVVGNSAGASNGVVACVYFQCSPEFYSSIFAMNTAQSGTDAGFGTLRGSHLWGNVPAKWGGQDVAGTPAPHFLDETPTDDPRQWDLHLAAGSTLVDAGYEYHYDDDLSVVDPGIYGGTTGAGWDLDGDGLPAWWQPGVCPASGWDCDDAGSGP